MNVDSNLYCLRYPEAQGPIEIVGVDLLQAPLADVPSRAWISGPDRVWRSQGMAMRHLEKASRYAEKGNSLVKWQVIYSLFHTRLILVWIASSGLFKMCTLIF